MRPIFLHTWNFVLEYRPHVRVGGSYRKNNSHMYELFLPSSYMLFIFQHEIADMLEYRAHVRVASFSKLESLYEEFFSQASVHNARLDCLR